MENLNKQALANARKSIAARFSETSHLDDLESYRNLIQKQLVSADSKLNVAVQGKLDALKRAVDLMDESASKLNQFTKNMAWINDRINQTCTSISNYEHLRKVHHARENLNKVISQVDFFGRVPERIAVLRQLLDSEPYHIKDVFVEAISHDALRQALLKEIKAANVGRRKSSADDTVSTKRRASVGGSAENEANLVRIRQVVENHLSIVPQLLRDIRARLWDNLERIWSLCAESPADIVVTFEILEMYQEYITRRADQARQRAERLGSDPESAYKQAYEHITGEARDRLKRKFDEKVESTFVLMQNSAVEGGVTGGEQKDSQVTITLNAATQMLTLMSSFRHEIVPCVPESYAPMTLFLDALDNYLVPEILQLVDTSTSEGISSLDVGDVIQLIDWLEYYVGQMDIIDQSDRESVEKFTTIAEELLNEYLDRIKHQVMEWFTNIKNQTTEIVVNNDGTLFTAKPEDMFNVLHMQMAVATGETCMFNFLLYTIHLYTFVI